MATELYIVISKIFDLRFDMEVKTEFICISLNAARELFEHRKKDYADCNYADYLKISIHETFWGDTGILNTGKTICEEYVEMENEVDYE